MLRSIGTLCCLALMLSACGTSTANDAVETTATTEVSTTSPSNDVVPIDTPVCDLLTADEVASAVGLDVAGVIENAPITCRFDLGVEADVDVFFTVDDGFRFQAYSDLIPGGGAESITVLGQAAVYAPAYRSLSVDTGGGRFIVLGVDGGYQQLQDPRDALILLAEAALARL